MRRFANGFSLIEAVVVLAIMAILAGAAAPLLMKTLDQQRTATTQASLPILWQAMFGSQSSRVFNMRSDFGFTPAAATTLTDLGLTMSRTAPLPAGGPIAAWPGVGTLQTGWHGPYWSGPTTTVGAGAAAYLVPADAWGRKIELVYNNGSNGWQLHSGGPYGQPGGANDIVYPSAPVDVSTSGTSTYMSTVMLVITSSRAVDTTGGTIAITDRNTGGLHAVTPSYSITNVTVPQGGSYPLTPVVLSVNPGLVNIYIHFGQVAAITAQTGPPVVLGTAQYPAVTLNQTIDLLPGQSQLVTFVLN